MIIPTLEKEGDLVWLTQVACGRKWSKFQVSSHFPAQFMPLLHLAFVFGDELTLEITINYLQKQKKATNSLLHLVLCS
jgi:hypothetical protein